MARKSAARFGELAQTQAPTPAPPPVATGEDQPLLPVALPQRRPSRSDKKVIAGHFPPAAAKALALLALERDTTLQALMAEAFNDLLRKHGRHPLF